jgi:hypothetical protein
MKTTDRTVRMKRVTGIGGIFFKAEDARSLQAGYKPKHAPLHRLGDLTRGL